MPSSIEIAGFKSIRELALDLAPLNVLVGANGAGKSNLIQVFGLLNEIVERRLQVTVAKAGGASTLLHHGPKQTPHLRLKFTEEPNAYEAKLTFAADDTLFFETETCYFHDTAKHDRPYDVRLGGGHRESRLLDRVPDQRVVRHVRSRLESWKVYHFHDTSTTAPVKLSGKLDDNLHLRADASNLAAFLYRLKNAEPDAYWRISAQVRLVAPFFEDFVLRPDRLKPDTIRLEWSETGSDAYLGAHALSDGTLRFMCLATLLLQPDLPSMVIVDEPELGLHPFAIAQLAGMLKAAATRTCVLVATQSVTLMNQFDPESVVVVERGGGQSTFRRLALEEIESWMDEYALGDIWEKNIFGGRPRRP